MSFGLGVGVPEEALDKSAEWAPFVDLIQHQVSRSKRMLLHQAAQNEHYGLEVHWSLFRRAAPWHNVVRSSQVCLSIFQSPRVCHHFAHCTFAMY